MAGRGLVLAVLGGLITSAAVNEAIIVFGILAGFILAVTATVVLTVVFTTNRIVNRALSSPDQTTFVRVRAFMSGREATSMAAHAVELTEPRKHAMPVSIDAPYWPDALVALHHVAPPSWQGLVVSEGQAGPFATRQPSALTIWAPDGMWPRAGSLLAMCKSARPDRSLVLTDAVPALDSVPADLRIAVVTRGVMDVPVAGTASYSCAELRNDRIFRLLLDGRAWQYPELAPLLHCHTLARTITGQRFLQREHRALAALFTGGHGGSMSEELGAGLEELARAARDLEQAVTGGFPGLDPRTGPEVWEQAAGQYLPLAAARSREVLALVVRWLASHSDWQMRPAPAQEELRCTAASTLYWLAGDPWLSSRWTADTVITGLSR